MDSNVEMITVDDADKAAEHGFFCYKSKPKAEGYRRKLAWLEQRFAEGLQIKMIHEDDRSVGFIEYTPVEFAWRPIEAEGYLAIHCLWVVGRAKEKGYGSRLLNACLEDARSMGKHGVVAATKKGGHLVGKKIFLKHGFEVVDQAPPAFSLVTRTFGDAPSPAFPHDWEERQARYSEGLTVVYADQCPYFYDAVRKALEAAEEVGIQARQAVELKSAQEVRELAPCPYGTFGIVYDGALVTCTPLGTKRLKKRLQELLVGSVK
jgi:GNAT superfamily N-acetyltransferase